jgi:predicted nucleic acid-binding protein
MKQHLLDASAFMLLIKKADALKTFECLKNSSILDLTYYEIGNAIWKETVLLKLLTPEGARTLQTMAQTVLTRTDCMSPEPDSFEKIIEIARTEKLTFYDASYIYFAKEKMLRLVTEDTELKTKAQKYVKVQNLTSLLSL